MQPVGTPVRSDQGAVSPYRTELLTAEGLPDLAPHYLLVVERHGTLDRMRVEVEAQPGVDASRHAQLAQSAVHHIKSLIGITTDVVIQAAGSIARSQGKAVRLLDLRPKAVA